MTQYRKGGTCVLDLMRAHQVGQRQVQQAAFVLIDQTTAFLVDVPVLTIGDQGRAKAHRGVLDDLHRLVRLRTDHHGHAAFDDAGLLACDLGQRVAEELFMVDGNRRNHRNLGRDDIGGVQTPAKADLQQGVIRRGARKRQQPRHGGDLEIGDALVAIGAVALIKHLRQVILGDQIARQTDAFVKAGQMRRGIGVDGFAPALKPGADHRLGGAFAIGARDMDHRGQFVLRVVQRRQETPDPIQRQVDDLGMQRHHTGENGVGGLFGHRT